MGQPGRLSGCARPSMDALALANRELNRRLGLPHSRVALACLSISSRAVGCRDRLCRTASQGLSMLSRLTTKVDDFPDSARLSGGYSTAYPDPRIARH
jgi:hypothetical protein